MELTLINCFKNIIFELCQASIKYLPRCMWHVGTQATLVIVKIVDAAT